MDFLRNLNPQGRQIIFHMRRHDGQGGTADKAVFLQQPQGLRQHPFRHTADAAAQGAEPQGAVLQGDQHQHAPAAGDVVQDHPRRAAVVQHIWGQVFGHFHTYKYVGTSFSCVCIYLCGVNQ